MDALDRAISIVGTQTALAAALRIKSPSISGWRESGRIPVERCIEIESLTKGKVTRQDLRPDIFGSPPKAAKKAA